MSKRILYLDILRIIACFGVIANHTNIILKQADIAIASVSGSELVCGILYMVLCKMAVTLFLMISGALLLRKVDTYKKIFQRIFRVGTVLIVFSAGYYIMGDYEHSIIDFVKTVTRTNVTAAFWYLYLYLGILVMLPVMQRMVSSFKKIDFWYFFFFALGICSFSFVTAYNEHFSLPIFATSVGIVMLGYYLDNYVRLDKYNFKMFMAVGALACTVIVTFLYLYTYRGVVNGSDSAYRLIVYDNVFYVALSICVFLMVKYAVDKWSKDKIKSVVNFIGSCTFGIYLFSDGVISFVMPLFEKFTISSNVHMLLIVIMLDIVVFLIGLVITALLKQVPVVKKFF